MKTEWEPYFLEWKIHSSVVNLAPGTLEIAFQGFEIPKFSGAAHPQSPLEEGDQWPLVDKVGYSI